MDNWPVGTITNGVSTSGFWMNDMTTSNQNNTLAAISGEMVIVAKKFDASGMIKKTPDELKKELLEMLVDELMNRGCVEFTQSYDTMQDITTVRARIYATPNDQVSILRLNKK